MQRQRHIPIWLRMLSERQASFRSDNKKLFKTQSSSAANAYSKERSIDAVEEIIKNGERQWRVVIKEHYRIVTKQFIDYTFEQLLGRRPPKENFDSRIISFIDKQALLKSKLITGTTIDRARNIISGGVADGDSVSEISDALEDGIGGAIADYRADMIARTEVHNAATFAMQETAEEVEETTSTDMTREWVAVDDERTRQWHADADGQTRGLDEPFDVDDEEIDRPGEGSAENAINCRCTLIYYSSSGDEVDPGDIPESDDEDN